MSDVTISVVEPLVTVAVTEAAVTITETVSSVTIDVGVSGPQGATGPSGGGGGGVPVGGTTGQVLTKNSGTDFDAGWSTPATGGSASWTVTEIDFGTEPTFGGTFTIVDAAVTALSVVAVTSAGGVASGRVGNDAEWDGFLFSASASVGSFELTVIATPGPVVGRRKVQYQIG